MSHFFNCSLIYSIFKTSLELNRFFWDFFQSAPFMAKKLEIIVNFLKYFLRSWRWNPKQKRSRSSYVWYIEIIPIIVDCWRRSSHACQGPIGSLIRLTSGRSLLSLEGSGVLGVRRVTGAYPPEVNWMVFPEQIPRLNWGKLIVLQISVPSRVG